MGERSSRRVRRCCCCASRGERRPAGGAVTASRARAFSGLPARVEDDNLVGGGEVEADAHLGADEEEEGRGVVVERVAQGLALGGGGGAVEHRVGVACKAPRLQVPGAGRKMRK